MVLPDHSLVLPEPVPAPPPASAYSYYMDKFLSLFSKSTDWNSPQVSRVPDYAMGNRKAPIEIQKVAIIGIHGWFPGTILRRVVGEPIGTSAKFSVMMSNAVTSYLKDNFDHTILERNIGQIPLEGEGKVQDRVNLLYEQLLDPTRGWVKVLKDADLVLISTHSQGVPVSSLLLGKLMDDGLVDPAQQIIGILGMAGISHGPYPSLKSSVIVKYVESDPARELFDFGDPKSDVSQAYHAVLTKLLQKGVKFVAVGSWYDQVVPLYSATLQGVNHPNIFRALYVDAADYQPDFLSHLVVLSLKLRNYGLSDYGLVVHLSEALQGNIYGFGTQGHQAIYEEAKTYTLAMAWILDLKPLWSPVESSSTQVAPSFHAPSRSNPYFLPWILAQIISDKSISGNAMLSKDLDDTLALFATWDTMGNKAYKDIRYRLEPLSSKL